jgi:hypothetical protein
VQDHNRENEKFSFPKLIPRTFTDNVLFIFNLILKQGILQCYKLKYQFITRRSMKISELCSMIEESIHTGKYPFESQQQKNLAKSVKIINRSNSDDLKSNDIKIEVRIQDLYTLNNYVANIEHLPGIIEMDILDSFKMLCRRADRVSSDLITKI